MVPLLLPRTPASISVGLYCDQLLLCLSGLIIDAFGELRDQQEQVKEDMEVRLRPELCMLGRKLLLLQEESKCFFFFFQTKCFICGIGNDYFDRTPHGFETHTLQEHNLANYLWVQQQTWTMTKVLNISILSDLYVLLSAGSS